MIENVPTAAATRVSTFGKRGAQAIEAPRQTPTSTRAESGRSASTWFQSYQVPALAVGALLLTATSVAYLAVRQDHGKSPAATVATNQTRTLFDKPRGNCLLAALQNDPALESLCPR